MTTLFTKIIDGEIPGRFLWSDERAVSFLTIGPITHGHALVVPREPVDEWLDADEDLLAHVTSVAKRIGNAQKASWDCPRVGLMVAGFEVPHLHVHVWPVYSLHDFSFEHVDRATGFTVGRNRTRSRRTANTRNRSQAGRLAIGTRGRDQDG